MSDFIKEDIADNWREFIMPWGKHQGWTMFQIYVNDFSYISEFLLSDKVHDIDVVAAAEAAMEHKNRVDPYSQF